jgi:hypothetical protein
VSDDPETLRQIEELSHDDRPLLVLDVDDVLLEFVRPFPRFLEERGFHLALDSFRLFGNVTEKAQRPHSWNRHEVTELIDDFLATGRLAGRHGRRTRRPQLSLASVRKSCC